MTNYSLEDVEKELLERRDAARSFHEFIKQAWPWVEGAREFVDGWHIQVIAEHLEALARGEIRNLLINIPPRCCKSTITAVMFPAWAWVKKPSLQFLYVSYAMGLSMRDSVKCRRVIESPWYQARWPHVNLSGDQSTKIRFDNTSLGYRLATSVDGTLTGEGGDILVCDDPNNVRDQHSDVTPESVVEWFTQVFSTRLNDPKTGRKVIIQQRAGENDVSGHILANERDEYVHLMLPMEFEPERRCYTIKLPSTNGEIWKDPRKKKGELLWPNRVGPEELNALKKALRSPAAVAGQLQQRPAPEEGGIFKKTWFKLWGANRPFPEFEYIIQSYDTAFTEKTQNDPTACSVWGIFKYEGKWCAMLLDCWTGYYEYPQLRKRVIEEYGAMYGDPARAVDLILIEDKGSGIALRRDLQQAGLPVKAYNPGKADKVQRANMVTHIVENGLIFLPESDDENRRGMVRSWIEPFLEELTMFPNGKHDDQVDCAVQAWALLKDMRLIEGESVQEEEEEIMESWDSEYAGNPYAQ